MPDVWLLLIEKVSISLVEKEVSTFPGEEKEEVNNKREVINIWEKGEEDKEMVNIWEKEEEDNEFEHLPSCGTL